VIKIGAGGGGGPKAGLLESRNFIEGPGGGGGPKAGLVETGFSIKFPKA